MCCCIAISARRRPPCVLFLVGFYRQARHIDSALILKPSGLNEARDEMPLSPEIGSGYFFHTMTISLNGFSTVEGDMPNVFLNVRLKCDASVKAPYNAALVRLVPCATAKNEDLTCDQIR